MMKKASLALGLILVLLVASTVTAGSTIDKIVKAKELVVGTSGDYPPFTATTKDGKLIGLDIDLANAIAASLEVKAKIVRMPFPELLSALQSGKIDMVVSAMTMTPTRNLKFAFVGPYFVSGQSILTTKETALKAEGLTDIDNPDFTLAAPGGTTSETIAKKELRQVKLIVAPNMDEALKLLLDGKVQAVMTDAATAVVARYRHRNIVASNPLTFEPIGIAVSGRDPLLTNCLDNLIGTLKGNGVLDGMVERWFNNPSWVKYLQ